MRYISVFTLSVLLIGASATVNAASNPNVLVVTTSNTAQNQLLVYDTSDNLVQTLSARGQGGVSGNSGGVAAHGNVVAAVNFGSKSVAVFERADKGLQFAQLISTASSPVSVAFGHDHLYILGTTKVESHRLYGSYVIGNPDGVAPLLLADGSAAQVGVLTNQVIITEKNNVIETVNLLEDGSVSGIASLVQNIPQNVNAPFGLVTRGNNAYVTIAHADEIRVRQPACTVLGGPGGTIPVFQQLAQHERIAICGLRPKNRAGRRGRGDAAWQPDRHRVRRRPDRGGGRQRPAFPSVDFSEG